MPKYPAPKAPPARARQENLSGPATSSDSPHPHDAACSFRSVLDRCTMNLRTETDVHLLRPTPQSRRSRAAEPRGSREGAPVGHLDIPTPQQATRPERPPGRPEISPIPRCGPREIAPICTAPDCSGCGLPGGSCGAGRAAALVARTHRCQAARFNASGVNQRRVRIRKPRKLRESTCTDSRRASSRLPQAPSFSPQVPSFWRNEFACEHCARNFFAASPLQARFWNDSSKRLAFSFWGGSMLA